jgi:hypothetical protein
VNYSEEYELRERLQGGVWTTRGPYSREQEAFDEMHRRSFTQGPGQWRVVRVSEVVIGTASKA